VAESIDSGRKTIVRHVRERNRWLADFLRSSRPTCAAIAVRPLLGTALAAGLLLTSEILVRSDELVCSLIGSHDAESC